MSDINAKFLMPEFTIDPVVNNAGKVTNVGIKRMYDIAYRIKDSIMQWSQPGVGKSQAVQQWNQSKVEEYNKRIEQGENVLPWNPVVCDIRLSMKEPVDLIGIPVPTKIDCEMRTVWCIPSVWPADGEYSGGVIHLDEMNQGQPAILNAAFQLIQDRQLGDYKVPDNYLIIASSNPPAFNGTVSELSMPLSNRFSHFNIKPDFDSWLNYEMNNGGNLDIMSFLKTQDTGLLVDTLRMENKIGDLSDTLYTDVFVTPRSWDVVGKVLDLGDLFTMEEKQAYCTGRLGSMLSAKLFEYIKNTSQYQSWREILIDKLPFRSESQDQFWAVQMACMQAIIGQKDDEICRKYILNYLDALRQLKQDELKACCFIQLSRCNRCKGKLNMFNPRTDGRDFVQLLTNAMRG